MDILSLADTFTLHRLKQSVFRFISENLKQFSSTAEFRAFTADQLASLLQANFPVNLSESDVLGAAAGWVEARPGERAESAHQVVEGAAGDTEPGAGRAAGAAGLTAGAGAASSTGETLPAPAECHLQDGIQPWDGDKMAVVRVGGFGPAGLSN